MSDTGTSRNVGLDLLRGLCACAVAAYHFLHWKEDLLITSMGTFSVYVFFILSAVTMMMVYGSSFSKSLTAENVRDFFQKRVARIVPLLAAVSLFAWLYNGGAIGWLPNAFLTGTGLMFLGLPGHYSISVGAWSLGIEFAFYAIFPLIALLLGKSRMALLITITVVLIIAQQLSLVLVPAEQFTWAVYTVPLTFAPFFALGIIVSKIEMRSSRWALWAGLCSLICLLFYSVITPLDVYQGGIPYIVLMLIAALAVLFFQRASIPGWLTAPSDFLGKISYAFYLTHWISYRYVERALYSLGIEGTAIFAAVFAVVAIGLSYLVYVLLEKPARIRLAGKRMQPIEANQV